MQATNGNTPTPGGYSVSFDEENPIPNGIHYSASYETTPLLSFSNPNEPPVPPVHSSGRNYNNTSNKYNTSGRYNSTPKYPSIKAYQPAATGPAGVYAVLITVILQSIGFTLVLPSMYNYAKDVCTCASWHHYLSAIISHRDILFIHESSSHPDFIPQPLFYENLIISIVYLSLLSRCLVHYHFLYYHFTIFSVLNTALCLCLYYHNASFHYYFLCYHFLSSKYFFSSIFFTKNSLSSVELQESMV